MNYSNTVFNQLLGFLPKSKFNQFVGQHNGDRYTKKMTAWNQFVALMYAQATRKESLREIETGFNSHTNIWHHLGVRSVAKSTLARSCNKRDYKIFEMLFYSLLEQCKEITPKNEFSFQNPLYSLDATVVKLCLSIFDWAKYSKTKGALKIHTLLDNRTTVPQLITITDGKVGDITAAKNMSLDLQKGSVLVFDRAYIDYSWWAKLDKQGIFFVSRQKDNQHIFVADQHPTLQEGVIADERIYIGEFSKYQKYQKELRRIKYYDKDAKKEYSFITNNLELSASQIAFIYKQRWQIEIFFKWIKQNLKIKAFVGTSKNAVLSQIWVAMIYYLLLAYIKFQTKFKKTLLELTRMIRETIFVRRNLIDLLSLNTNTVKKFIEENPQMSFF